MSTGSTQAQRGQENMESAGRYGCVSTDTDTKAKAPPGLSAAGDVRGQPASTPSAPLHP